LAKVELRNVSKRFGAVEVIHGIDITVPDGAFLVLVGPSGCGKSTLLRMVAGLEPISGGTVAIGGRVVNGVPPKNRDIAMVFQNYALYPHMTVTENMSFSLRLRRAAQDEMRRKVGGSAAILGLDKLLERYPRQLSGGQRQRVAMGRAIVRDPQVFLFDEPLSNLDAKLRVHMRTEIKELHQRLKTTTIYVTHDQIEAMTLADLIVVLRDGRIEQVGTPLELYDTPANTFVAGFIGSPSMNLLPGRAAGDGIELDGGDRLAIDGLPVAQGGPVICGIRPEDLSIADDGTSTLAFEVGVVEPTGAETMVIGRASGAQVTAVFRERRALEPGQRLHLRPRVVHVFDGAGERRVL
jgi:multiple sugar transport system ATP-binding protein